MSRRIKLGRLEVDLQLKPKSETKKDVLGRLFS